MSRDTSEFVTDNLCNWWNTQGQYNYPSTTKMLIRYDGGRSNGSQHYIFRQDLQNLASEIGIPIQVTHYPPYCSKYNPLEHRLFPHLTRACQGVIFTSVGCVKDSMANTKTKQGLSVTADITDKLYRTGHQTVYELKQSMKIVFNDYLF